MKRKPKQKKASKNPGRAQPQIENEITEEQIKTFLKELKKGNGLKVNDVKKTLQYTDLKNINVVPNQLVKAIIQIDDIQPGVNIIKGYNATCPKCKRNKTVYNNYQKECSSIFGDDKLKVKEEPCIEIGPRGGATEITCSVKSITDTGFFCSAYDPNDMSGNVMYANVFFSNNIIPQNKEDKMNFEINIRSKKIEVLAVIRLLQKNTTASIQWVLDVIAYDYVEEKIDIDYELLHKFKDIPRDDGFFQNNFVPAIYQRTLDKKVSAIFLLNPLRIKFPNGIVTFSTMRVICLGDMGQSKTVQASEMMKYYKKTNVDVISIEDATVRGIIARTEMNRTTKQWTVRPGAIIKRHESAIFCDGYGKFNPTDFAQIRGIEEENMVQIIKAGHMKKECVLHMYFLGNILKKVSDYPTKHMASYDLACTTSDYENKFSGPDRRRKDHVLVIGDDDIDADAIDIYRTEIYNPKKEDELADYWNNMRAFSWSRRPDDFIWEDKIEGYINQKLSELRKRYGAFSLEYGVLSKGGHKIFTKQLPGVALLHESIDKKYKIQIKKEHVDWLFNLYDDEFIALGLSVENESNEFYEKSANAILLKCKPELIKILGMLFKYGSQSAIERSGQMNRKSIFRAFRDVIEFYYSKESYEDESTPSDEEQTKLSDSDIEDEPHIKTKTEYEQGFYSFSYGSGTAKWKGPRDDDNDPIPGKGYYEFVVEDGNLPPLNKRDGTLTDFGRILTKKAYHWNKGGMSH